MKHARYYPRSYQDMIKRGVTLEQVKAAQPTRDYDARYGKKSGSWTKDMFYIQRIAA